jgi:hypothetical protein
VNDRPERRIANALRRRGLDLPARVLLDAHRPLAPLLADACAALGPVLGAALPPRAADAASRLLDDADEDPLNRLLTALDEHDDRDAVAG